MYMLAVYKAIVAFPSSPRFKSWGFSQENFVCAQDLDMQEAKL